MTTLRLSMAIVLTGVLAVAACRGDAHGNPPGASEAPAAESGTTPFTVSVATPTLKAGASADAKVTVTPATGYHWNLEYPAKLVFEGSPSKVALTKKEFNQLSGDFRASETKADIAVALQGKDPGKETLKGELKFSVCNDTTCLIKSAPVELAVVVSP